ncbi:MAG TPA: hypothetical protein VI942_00295 [Thermoanaerobaculia bacterium]|nr:hypothetical protein [Thermoanaerobaculia bacterium]
MNWTRVVLGGLAAGIVTNIVDFVMHGMLLGKTYQRYTEAFSQTPANPLHFFVVAVAIGVLTAVLFARSRGSWGDGWKGGATFGLYLGLAGFFASFYNPLVIDGFPYYLAWCWGGIHVIDGVVGGAVLGAVVPREGAT